MTMNDVLAGFITLQLHDTCGKQSKTATVTAWYERDRLFWSTVQLVFMCLFFDRLTGIVKCSVAFVHARLNMTLYKNYFKKLAGVTVKDGLVFTDHTITVGYTLRG